MPRPTSAAAASRALRKSRGAFFTPLPLARHIVDWAIRDAEDRILEPSCGEAAFLLAAIDRLNALRAASPTDRPPHLDGVELHKASAAEARSLLQSAGVEADVRSGDFFDIEPTGSYDAVVGNPPYVRYQDFGGNPRTRSRKMALRAGVSLSKLASSWAAFTVHAALFLQPGGRLGLVLPAELLTVNYAAEVRRFLMERFASVALMLFQERVFPDALEEVVLLMADGYGKGPTDRCQIFQATNAEDLPTSTVSRVWKPLVSHEKWTPSLLPTPALHAFTDLLNRPGFTTLETWGDTTLGIVTGNNRFFALCPDRVEELDLARNDLEPLSPPGSRHLRAMTYTPRSHWQMAEKGAPTWLFRPSSRPSPAAAAYIEAGERTGVDRAYKCRTRNPWWRVPLVPPADLLLTYMNADTPRLCTNRARVHHLNSVHGVYLKPDVRRLGMDLLPLVSLNSMTLVAAETVGRAYGGGMLKLEPREADRLPLPAPALAAAARGRLSPLRPKIARLLRQGRLLHAVRLVDQILLVDELRLDPDCVNALRNGHAELTARRRARGR